MTETKQDNYLKSFKIGKYEVVFGLGTILFLIGLSAHSIAVSLASGKPHWAAASYIVALGFVLFHEIGHLLAANYYGDTGYKIQILPIGGMAFLKKDHEGWPHFVVAFAGPLVNLLFAAVFTPFYLLFDKTLVGDLFWYVVLINLVLFIFNVIIPIYPTDGGRIVRSVLEMANWERIKILKFNTFISVVGFLFCSAILTYVGSYLAAIALAFVFSIGIMESYRSLKLEKALFSDILKNKWMFMQVSQEFTNKAKINTNHTCLAMLKHIFESDKYKNYSDDVIHNLILENMGNFHFRLISVEPEQRKETVEEIVKNFAWP